MNDDEKLIEAWFGNSVATLEKNLRRKLGYPRYMDRIRRNQSIDLMITNYRLEEYWDRLSKRLNDFVHNNGVSFSQQNILNPSTFQYAETQLRNVNFRVAYIASFFIALLFITNGSVLASTTYSDHMMMEMTPPENSQYFIAGFIQDFIDKKLIKLHPELKQYLVENNRFGMIIE